MQSPTSSVGWAEPTFATPRTDRESLGWRLGNISRELGLELMGWQQHVADVGLEVDAETGRLVYKEIIVSVMRQNGKTTLVLAAECARCLLWGSEQRVAYTAQTGADARMKFKEDQLPLIQASPLNALVKRPYLSDGNTALLWENGSRISVLSSTEESGHGKTLDLAVVDEAFSDADNRREQALLPTMATRLDPQIWNTSTAGTSASTYLRRKVEVGRASVAAGDTDGIAYFEWSIRDDEDVDDPKVWAHRMPAYGVTIFDDYIKHARRSMTDGDFRRAIGNQWTETEERVIPGEWWRAVTGHDVRADPATCYAIDARADRSQAVVAKAGGINVELVAVREGVDWLTEAFNDKKAQRLPIVVDRNGPAAGQADRLEAAGHTVVRYESLPVRKSCGRFYDAIADKKLRVRADERLDIAVKHATQRSTADAWSWHREPPGGESLMALSMAYDNAQETWEPLVGTV